MESGVQALRDRNQIHDAMRINSFLNPVEENVKDDDDDVLADIVHAHSIGEARGDEIE